MATSSKTEAVSEQIVAQFIAVTGAERTVALSLLEACAGNLDLAVGMHMDSGQAGPSSAGLDDSPIVTEEEDGVRAPIPQRTEVLVEEEAGNVATRLRRPKRQMRSVFDGFRDFQAEARQYEGSIKGKNLSKKRNLEDLFRPPVDMTYKGTFQSARNFGSEQNRWLLVNVQNVQEFPCQLLNRDVWSHSEARRIVQEKFVFWQVYNDSEEGKRFMQFYKVSQWPYVAVIDPFTGENQVVWNKIPDGSVFCELARDFLNMSPVPDSSQMPTSAKRQKREPSIVDASEQEQLEAAIQASLAEENKMKEKAGSAAQYVSNSDSEPDFVLDSDDDDLETFTDSDSDVIVSSPKHPVSSTATNGTSKRSTVTLPTKDPKLKRSSPSSSSQPSSLNTLVSGKNCSKNKTLSGSLTKKASENAATMSSSSSLSSHPTSFSSSSNACRRSGNLSRTHNDSEIQIIHEDIDDEDNEVSEHILSENEEDGSEGMDDNTASIWATAPSSLSNHNEHHHHIHTFSNGNGIALSPAVVDDNDNNSLLDMLGTREAEVSTPQFSTQDDEDDVATAGTNGTSQLEAASVIDGACGDDDWKRFWGNSDDPKSKIMLRFPNNIREQVELPCSSQLKALSAFCDHKGYSPKEYELVTNFPRRKLSQMDASTTLKDAGLYPQDTVFVQDL